MAKFPVKICSAIFLCSFFFTATPLSGPAWGANDPTANATIYEDALKRFDAGDHKGAIIQLKNVLQKDAHNISARVLLGRAYLASGFAVSAAKEFTVARRGGADDAFTLVPLGKAYALMGAHDKILTEIRLGNRGRDIETDIRLVRAKAHFALRQLDQAEREFNQISKDRPDSIDPLLGLARIQMERGDLEYAEEFVGAAIFRNVDNSDVWYTSGDLKRNKRDMEGAIVDFARAIELNPHSVQARMARAATYIDLGRHKDATVDVEYVREKIPLNPRAIYFHALILTQANKPQEAKAALDAASKILEGADPTVLVNSPPALLLAGTVAYFRQEFESARNHLARYIELAPRHVGPRRILATLLLRHGDAKTAIAVLKPAMKLAPKNVRIVALLGSAFMQNRQHGQAAKMFQRAATLAPNIAAIQTNLGMSWLNAGQDESATQALRAALALDPSEAQAAVLLSLARLKRGDFKAALEATKILIEQDPKNPIAHNMTGGALVGLGDFAGARVSFEKALVLDPSYMSARFNLAKLDIQLGKIKEGEARYQAILTDAPKNANAMAAMGRIAERKGNIKEAIRWLEKARISNPKLISEQVYLIDLHIDQKNNDEALQIAKALTERAPRSPSAVASRGRAELAAGARAASRKTFRRLSTLAKRTKSVDWLVAASELQHQAEDVKEAVASLKTALEINPKHLPALTAMFNHDVRLGHLDAARQRAQHIRYSQPNSAVGLTLLGDLAMRRNRYSEAVKHYGSAMKKRRSSTLVIRLHRAFRRAGKNREMIALLENWVAQQPKDNAARRALAAGYKNIGQIDASLKLHEALLTKAPNDPALLNNLALLYQEKKDPRALPTAEKAYRNAPNQAATADTYGWILVQNGEEAKGLQLLRNAHVRAPKVPEIRYHIAAALHRLGRPKAALLELEAVFSSRENFESAAEARALREKLSGR